MDDLKTKTASGLFWGLMSNGTTQVLNLVFGIFLGRLLSPSDYGMVGVLTIFTAIAGNLQSSGFSQALANLKHASARDYNSVFWFNVSVSTVMYIILFFAAPLIARFFRQEELVELSRFVFLAFLISSLGIAHGAYMFRNLMVRENTLIGIVALLASGVTGITLALHGKAYWSIAWQQVVYISVLNVGRYCYVPWRPSFSIDFGPVRRMFGFSSKILITSIITTLNQNLLVFIFGRLYPMRSVGNFSQANKWNTMASSLVASTLAQVSQPVLARIGDDDDRERRVFRKLMRFTAFISFPAMLGLAMVADEFILLTIGQQWESCVPLLRVLCLGGAFLPLYTLYQNLMISRGRSDLYLWCNVAQVLLQLVLVLAFARLGIGPMVIAYTVMGVLFMAVWQYFLNRMTGIRAFDIMKDICPFMLIAAVVMGVTYLLTVPVNNRVLLFGLRVVIAAVLYFVVMKALRVKILDECMEFFTSKFKKR